ncbi:MAG: hypothetical protein AAFX08_09715 [Pseudomonadota bacterium]
MPPKTDRLRRFSDAPAVIGASPDAFETGAAPASPYPGLLSTLTEFGAVAADDGVWAEASERARAMSAFMASVDRARLSSLDPLTAGLPFDALIKNNAGAFAAIAADGSVLAVSDSAKAAAGIAVGKMIDFAGTPPAEGAPVAALRNAAGRPLTARIVWRADAAYPEAAYFLYLDSMRMTRRTRDRLHRFYDLAPAELDVLDAALRRQSVAETAEERGRSPDTVRTQHARILKKLGADSMIDATLAVAALETSAAFDPERAVRLRARPEAPSHLSLGPTGRQGGAPKFWKRGDSTGRGLVFIPPLAFPAPPSEAFCRAANAKGWTVFAPTPAATPRAREGGGAEDQDLEALASALERARGDAVIVAAIEDAPLVEALAKTTKKRVAALCAPMSDIAPTWLHGLARAAAEDRDLSAHAADALALAPGAASLSDLRVAAFGADPAPRRSAPDLDKMTAFAADALLQLDHAQVAASLSRINASRKMDTNGPLAYARRGDGAPQEANGDAAKALIVTMLTDPGAFLGALEAADL